MITFYKYLNTGRVSPLQNWQWPKVGVWTSKVARLEECIRGYHACRPGPSLDLLVWSGDELYELEYREEPIAGETKVFGSQARLIRRVKTWNARTQRLFACDCAARVLKFYEEKYPNDKRPREAIRVARAFANGKASEEEMAAAGDAAARATAGDAAWAAAAGDAAARATAGDAAWAAAAGAAAAGAAERQWQIARLMKYIKGEIG